MTKVEYQPSIGHTPTPWTIEFSDKAGRFTLLGQRGDGNVRASDGYGFLFYLDASVMEDADVCQFPRISPEMAANASLIFEAVNNYESLKARVAELEAPMSKRDFIRRGIQDFKEHELREIVATFCRLPGIAPVALNPEKPK